MWIIKSVLIFYCILVNINKIFGAENGFVELKVLENTINECIRSSNSSYYGCLSEKSARALERAMEWKKIHIPFVDGMVLQRNNETVTINHRQARVLGFNHLTQTIKNFFLTHTISVELGGGGGGGGGEARGDGFGGFGGGGGGFNRKDMKKEKKYVNYAFMVLLGIFGLTGPLVMKILALMAAKSILAAKAALIIVGSVALKKLFEKDHPSEPAVKVHTINHDSEDQHDRLGKFGYTGYGGYENNNNNNNSPYSSYYDDFYYKNLEKPQQLIR